MSIYQDYKNKNVIYTEGFSNLNTLKIYDSKYKDYPIAKKYYERGWQCFSCSFYGEFNFDWGLCCCKMSDFYLETIFEHFSCEKYSEWD